MNSTPYITLDHDARELSAAEIDAFASRRAVSRYSALLG